MWSTWRTCQSYCGGVPKCLLGRGLRWGEPYHLLALGSLGGSTVIVCLAGSIHRQARKSGNGDVVAAAVAGHIFALEFLLLWIRAYGSLVRAGLRPFFSRLTFALFDGSRPGDFRASLKQLRLKTGSFVWGERRAVAIGTATHSLGKHRSWAIYPCVCHFYVGRATSCSLGGMLGGCIGRGTACSMVFGIWVLIVL